MSGKARPSHASERCVASFRDRDLAVVIMNRRLAARGDAPLASQAKARASGRLNSISTKAISASPPFITSCSMPAGR
jgi:hypothetical protein